MSASGPIFLAGIDRSGIGLLCELLEAHPNIAMTRRTNFWTLYLNRFGDLGRAENFERCLAEMMAFRRMQIFRPDPHRLRREFERGEKSYTRLFEMLQIQRAERLGKTRWGDKSLNSERFADAILTAYPDAKMIHIIRDPRDRCASLISHRGVARTEAVSVGTRHWLRSVQMAALNARNYPGQYKVIRYESLAADPHITLREVCHFVGEDYPKKLLEVDKAGGVPGPAAYAAGEKVANPIQIRTTSIGRYRTILSPREIAFIQIFAGRQMVEHGYGLIHIELTASERRVFCFGDIPRNSLQIGYAHLKDSCNAIVGRRRHPPPRKISASTWNAPPKTTTEQWH